jgi:hypothetical protein
VPAPRQPLHRGISTRLFSTHLHRRLAAVGAALVLLAAVVIGLARPASAADSITLLDGVTSASDLAVGGGHVFVAANDRIVVADTQGTPTTAITALAGVRGLAITPDGSRLYAAVCDSRQIIEVDTASLTITRQFDLSLYPCPSHPWLAGSQLWVGYGDRGTFDGGIVNLNLAPDADPIALPVQSPPVFFDDAPVVVAAGTVLAAGSPGLEPATILVYDVTGSTATLHDTIDGVFQGNIHDLNDMAITADGSTLFEVGGGPQAVTVWDTTSLTELGTYPSGGVSPLALALSPDGRQAHWQSDFYRAGGSAARCRPSVVTGVRGPVRGGRPRHGFRCVRPERHDHRGA